MGSLRVVGQLLQTNLNLPPKRLATSLPDPRFGYVQERSLDQLQSTAPAQLWIGQILQDISLDLVAQRCRLVGDEVTMFPHCDLFQPGEVGISGSAVTFIWQ